MKKVKFHIKSGITAKGTHYWFTIVSKNGKILATSEIYKTKRSAIKGVVAILTGVAAGYTLSLIVDKTTKNK